MNKTQTSGTGNMIVLKNSSDEDMNNYCAPQFSSIRTYAKSRFSKAQPRKGGIVKKHEYIAQA
jgi:hypothetical protein